MSAEDVYLSGAVRERRRTEGRRSVCYGSDLLGFPAGDVVFGISDKSNFPFISNKSVTPLLKNKKSQHILY